jgi:hypothetical protein
VDCFGAVEDMPMGNHVRESCSEGVALRELTIKYPSLGRAKGRLNPTGAAAAALLLCKATLFRAAVAMLNCWSAYPARSHHGGSVDVCNFCLELRIPRSPA